MTDTVINLECKTYSQYKQDVILNEKYFKNNRNGVFLDIGANHPRNKSNTYLYESTLNWSGICIEPQNDMYELLKAERNCIVLKTGVYSEKTELEFCKTITGLCGLTKTYDKKHKMRIERESKAAQLTNQYYSIPVDTIENIVNAYNISVVDYVSLDTEGSELEILKGINFDTCHINIIDVEFNYPNTRKSYMINELLEQKNFKYEFNINHDRIYVNNNLKFSWEI